MGRLDMPPANLAEQAQDGVIIDVEGRIAWANHLIEIMLGYEPGELSGKSMTGLGGDHGRSAARYETALRHKRGYAIPVEITRYAYEWCDRPASLLMVRDIGEIKRSGAALVSAQLRQIVDLLPEAILVKDGEGRFLLANRAAAEFFGTTVEQLIGKRASDFHLAHEFTERFQDSDQTALAQRSVTETPEQEVPDATGRRHIMQALKIPFIVGAGEPAAVLAVVSNLTERRRAESALAQSERRLRHSLHYANLGNWDWDILTGELYWSELVAPLFGHGPGEKKTSYEDFLAAIHPADREAVDAAARASIASGRDYVMDHRVVWPDGTLRWLHASGGVVHDDQGSAVRMMGVVQDITERKLTEQALTESERRYRALMEHASDAILLGTPAGWLIDANRRAEELFGYSREELLKMHGTDIHPEEDHETLAAALHDLNTKGSSLYDHLILHKDGRVSSAEVAATAIEYQGQKILMAIFRDTTVRRRLEQERLGQAKAQRDALVREVHHRIKNNLQGVVGLLRGHITRRGELREPLESAVQQVNAMAVVHGLFGQSHSETIFLCDMVSAICKSACGITGKPVQPSLEVQVSSPHQVSRDEAVPLALILNELVFNAIKHQAASSQTICVNVRDHARGARVTILTPDTALPAGFDFGRGRGLGTGLQLIKSLLPSSGCGLWLRDHEMGVMAEIELAPPVILA